MRRPVHRQESWSSIALAAMLVLGNLFFLACIAGQRGPAPQADWSRRASPPARIVLAGD